MDASSGTRAPEPRPFSWPVRVYHEDTDSGGVVYYASYLRFLERARTEWLRALGFEQRALAERHRVAFVVRSLRVEYLRPARLDDALAVTVEPVETGAVRIVLAQRVVRAAEVLVAARAALACVNTGTFRAVRIPRELASALARQPAVPQSPDRPE